jgi:hypothetical protein
MRKAQVAHLVHPAGPACASRCSLGPVFRNDPDWLRLLRPRAAMLKHEHDHQERPAAQEDESKRTTCPVWIGAPRQEQVEAVSEQRHTRAEQEDVGV